VPTQRHTKLTNAPCVRTLWRVRWLRCYVGRTRRCTRSRARGSWRSRRRICKSH
jgi:hypothetical protein